VFQPSNKPYTTIEFTFSKENGESAEETLSNIGPHGSEGVEFVWIGRFRHELDGLNERLRMMGIEPIGANIDSQEYPLGLPPRSVTRPWTPDEAVRWIEIKFLEYNPGLAERLAA
jgi:hypothetical protein